MANALIEMRRDNPLEPRERHPHGPDPARDHLVARGRP